MKRKYFVVLRFNYYKSILINKTIFIVILDYCQMVMENLFTYFM